MNLREYKKGPEGIRYKASILPWKVNKGQESVLIFEFFNPTQKNLTPTIGITAIKKKGLIGGRIFECMDAAPNNFWVGPSKTLQSTIKPNAQAMMLLPIVTHTTTDAGDYEIEFGLKVKEEPSAKATIKKIAKIALALTIGSFSKRYYFQMKVEDRLAKPDSLRWFPHMVHIDFKNQRSFFPSIIMISTYTHGEYRHPTNDSILIIRSVSVKDDSEREQFANIMRSMMIESDTVESLNLEGNEFEYRSGLAPKNPELFKFDALGYVTQLKEVVLFTGIAKQHLKNELNEMFNSVTFIPKEE